MICKKNLYFCRFESRLIKIFTYINCTYKSFESRLKAESFKSRISLIFKAWEEWAIFPQDFIEKCNNTFLGVAMVSISK